MLTYAEARHVGVVRSAEHLEQALNRFAQFFISPLISEDGVEREVKAVHSECAPHALLLINIVEFACYEEAPVARCLHANFAPTRCTANG